MFKPAKCYGSTSDVRIAEEKRGVWCVYLTSISGNMEFCEIIIYASTRIGAILRWNWKQWRARWAMKGDAKT